MASGSSFGSKVATGTGIVIAVAVIHSGALNSLTSAIGKVTASGAHPPAMDSVGVPASANVALGQRLAARDYGWTGNQWTCLYWLWNRESGWSNTALNPKSGADGIAQALGHGPTNQYPAGPANPPVNDPRAQILWGLQYIKTTPGYGTPCAAEAHETADGWY